MENTDHQKENLIPAYDHFTFIGALQLLPILFLLCISGFGFLLLSLEVMDRPSTSSRFFVRDISLVILLFINTLGLFLGMSSSFFFFYASKHKNLNMLNKGIICNAIAWIVLAIMIIVIISRPEFL